MQNTNQKMVSVDTCFQPIENPQVTLQATQKQLEDEIKILEKYIKKQISQKIHIFLKDDIFPRMNHLKKLGIQINQLSEQLETAVLSFQTVALEIDNAYRQISIEHRENKNSSQCDHSNFILVSCIKLPVVVSDTEGYFLKDKDVLIKSQE